jgi:hypothetical protein
MDFQISFSEETPSLIVAKKEEKCQMNQMNQRVNP